MPRWWRGRPPALVIYTAIFGGRDLLIEPFWPWDGIRFVCFSDVPRPSRTWEVRVVTPPAATPRLSARYFKLHPHRLFPDDPLSLWIDANIWIRRDPRRLLVDGLSESDLALYDHAQCAWDPRDCVYLEAEACKTLKKDDPSVIDAQMARYRAEGLPEHAGLGSTMALARRHHHDACRRLMEMWWQELQTHSSRDQLSFNYVVWKSGFQYSTFAGDCRHNRWFRWRRHVA